MTKVRKNAHKRTAKQWFFTILIHVWLLFMVFVVVVPVMWVIGSSFTTSTAVSDIKIIPDNPSFINYKELFEKSNFALWYKNTLIIAVLTMIFTSLINIFTAFIFARFPFRGRKPLLMFIMLFTMFPSFLGLTAIYVICLNFGLLNNIYTLVVIYVAGSIPGNIFLARGYLLNVPKSLDEAAYIDGASKFQLFYRIVLPLSVPIISFLAFGAFMGPWFDFILPRMLLSANENTTVAIGLWMWTDQASSLYNIPRFAAGSVIVAVPITILYVLLQRFIITGITAGANKGE
jgi:arabinogalactan oligomer/maltooligosaccharide transport system permease protein